MPTDAAARRSNSPINPAGPMIHAASTRLADRAAVEAGTRALEQDVCAM